MSRTMERTIEEPPRIEGYEALTPLGRGGMGVVYRAREQALQRWVALKMIPADGADAPGARSLLREEAHRLARIGHPNVVPIHAFGECDGRAYFTMTYVEGETLARSLRAAAVGEPSRFGRFFRRGDDDEDRRADLAACIVARALADALEHLHAAGVVHRDLKPANVLLDPQGRPILVDLGIASDGSVPASSSDLLPAGTLRFLAPELVDGSGRRADARSDVYALGLVLFEMLTLRPAFAAEDARDLVDAIRRGDLPSLRQIDPRRPATLDHVVSRATALSPEDRFSGAAEFGAALAQATAELADPAEITHLALGDALCRALGARWTRARRGWRLPGLRRLRR